jgi:hypothetical protein
VTTNKAVFTTQPMAEPFGWRGQKPARRPQTAPARPPQSSLGNLEPARVADFVAGATEAHDRSAHATLRIIEGAAAGGAIGYLAGKAIQH